MGVEAVAGTSDPGRDPAWSRIASLFDQAIELPAAEWAGWLDRVVGSDPAARRELEALLAAHQCHGVLDRPVLPGAPDPAAGREAVLARLGRSLAGRYRVERVLGEGGMATVFLARELKHDRPVVLKVLKPEMAVWLGVDRFQAEIRIVARLSHPYILGLIDSGEAGGLLYYVMPHVDGETLRARLKRGPVPVQDLLTVLGDVARALAHAHRHEIVHRDLKPENVLVVGGHGFLMDFGVAKLRPAPGAIGQTADGVAIGTPAYMAPEQAAGGPVDARADVYSWGLVARESLLGTLSRGVDLDRACPDAPAELRALITECLAEDPGARPRDGSDVVQRLLVLEESTRADGATPRLRWLLPAGLMAGLAALLFILVPRGPKPPALEAMPGPIAVAGLRNETGDSSLSVWGRLAGDWITQGLQQTARAKVVPWSVALEVSSRIDGARPVEGLRDQTGAGTVITGSYYRVGEALHLQVELVDAASGTLIGTIPAVEVTRDSIQRGIHQLRERLMGALAVRTDDRLAGTPGLASRPPTYDAYLAFERGLDLYNRMDYATAGESLIEAWRTDTVFLAPLVYAARAVMNTGNRERVDSLLGALRARQVSLSSYDDHQVRYLESLLASDANGALEAIRLAVLEAPRSRAAYNLAITALSANRAAEALASLQTLDPDRGAVRDWAPYWYNLCHALHLLGRHEEELTAVQELRRRHPDSRAAWVHEARALAALGRTAALDSLLDEAEALPPDTYWSQGAAMVTAGEELDAHGRSGRSRPYYRRAQRWLANQLVRDANHRAHRYWLGSAYYDEGRWADAEPYFESLAHDFPRDVGFRGMWALIAARSGDTATARRRLGAPPRFDRGGYTSFRARLAAVGGNPEMAVDLWSEALGQGLSALVWLHAAGRRDLEPLAGNPRFQKLALLPASAGRDQ